MGRGGGYCSAPCHPSCCWCWPASQASSPRLPPLRSPPSGVLLPGTKVPGIFRSIVFCFGRVKCLRSVGSPRHVLTRLNKTNFSDGVFSLLESGIYMNSTHSSSNTIKSPSSTSKTSPTKTPTTATPATAPSSPDSTTKSKNAKTHNTSDNKNCTRRTNGDLHRIDLISGVTRWRVQDLISTDATQKTQPRPRKIDGSQPAT